MGVTEIETTSGEADLATNKSRPLPNRIQVGQRWDRKTTETFAVGPFCRRQCFDDQPETCCRHRVGLVIDEETCQGFVQFEGVPSCPCSSDQPVKAGFRYCVDCLSIASTDANFREDDYRAYGGAHHG